MLTKEAIAHIQQDSNLKELNNRLLLDGQNAIVIKNDEQLQRTEHLNDQRDRFRGAFVTSNLASFAQMVREQSETTDETIATFINCEQPKATAIFNLGDTLAPGHCDHQATLQLRKTPAYQSFLENTGTFLSQDDMYYFLLDWRDIISIDGDNNEQAVKKAIVAMRDISIKTESEANHKQSDYANEASAFAKAEAQTGGAKPPATISFNIQPYEGLSSYTLETSVIIDFANPQKPRIKLRPNALQASQDAMLEAFKTKLTESLGAHATCYFGTFNP